MRRAQWLTAAALVLASAAACTSGTPGATHAPIAHPPLTSAAALAVVRHYDDTIDAALDAKSPARLETLETGTALATSDADRLFATAARPASTWRHTPAHEQIYLSPQSTYPQWFVSTFPYADDEGRTEFSVFQRDQPGGQWLKSVRTMSTAHVLSSPVVTNGAVEEASPPELARAKTAVADLIRYIQTGSDRGTLTDVMLAQNDAELFWARLHLNSDWESGKATCYVNPHSLFVTMRTRDGAVETLGSITCTYVLEARPGNSVDLPPSARTWGITRLKGVPGYTYDDEKQFVLSMSRDGSAKVIGYSYATVSEQLI
ncbi:MAG: hypothetical protein M3P23_11295 [Actinomycetota bacterium]|nr:hypothetical protein [Actinomycetota bacterium]